MEDQKVSSTSDRLKSIMKERKLKQVDILNMCAPYCKIYDMKMNKSALSQYVSGKSVPDNQKLIILGLALDVSEPWLMGFDVPMSRDAETKLSKFDVVRWIRNDATTQDLEDVFDETMKRFKEERKAREK